jgi:hypothetical protein
MFNVWTFAHSHIQNPTTLCMFLDSRISQGYGDNAIRKVPVICIKI